MEISTKHFWIIKVTWEQKQFTIKHLFSIFFFLQDNDMEFCLTKFKQNLCIQFVENWKFSGSYFLNERFLFVFVSSKCFHLYFHFQPTQIWGCRLLELTYRMLFIGNWRYLYLFYITGKKSLIAIHLFISSCYWAPAITRHPVRPRG